MAHDPDGTRLPIKLDTTTNGEFAPIPLERVHHEARSQATEAATHNARRLAVSRRSFLVSACGAATTLLAMNRAYAMRGSRGSGKPDSRPIIIASARPAAVRTMGAFHRARSIQDQAPCLRTCR